jgi:rubrerythrin
MYANTPLTLLFFLLQLNIYHGGYKMTIQQDQQDIWILLEIHEERLSMLYNAYAKKFPEHEAFWSSLAAEEVEHARLVRQLSEEKEAVDYNTDKLNPSAIETSIGYLNDQLANIKKYDISFINALSIAMNFERSTMDGKVYEAFKGRTTSTKSILEKLKIGLKKHVDIVEKAWANNRKFA